MRFYDKTHSSPLCIRCNRSFMGLKSSLNAINFNRIDPNRSVSETWTLKNNGKTGKLRKIKN